MRFLNGNGGAKINNQDKDITSNGIYSADEGYTGLGQVTVNVPQEGEVPIKLFKSQEEMQADPAAKEGDLAIVYDSEQFMRNMLIDDELTTIYCPETVVLSEPFIDDIKLECQLR